MEIYMLVIKKEKKGKHISTEKLDLLEDVCHIGVENRTITYHTEDETYYQISTFEEMSKILEQYGYEVADRGSLINMKKITKLDTEFSRVFFDEHITNESRFATVSAANIKKIKKYLESKRESGSDPSTKPE
ncbi:LytTR family transcriptional regulator DNA-binding domain-containing protein [Paenibacillus flagellatus]|uniref:HTH LytTR-type domain-containing protein n=1 Tax=Paenibacillus flagellatus TaxID=2211139 RepID=A0A2V5L2V6_9BACL|nr:LytTR family transcriptional regulator DNA-binding domain-containing protein [Paenibacillus flagellatus]PYI57076.1 hypothetical protein DLM86_01100 [Paenibacillus flagellatus]